MRCPDCQKFVSMENGEPQIDDISVDESNGNVTVSLTVRGTRTCADCGTELKDLQIDMEDQFELTEMKLSREDGQPMTDGEVMLVKRRLDQESDQLEIEFNTTEQSSDASEAGGSRYQKNMITTTVKYEIIGEFESDGVKYQLSDDREVTSENAASEFDECC